MNTDTQFSIGGIIKESWSLTKKNLSFLVPLFAVLFALGLTGNFFVSYVMDVGILFGFVAQILVSLLQMYFSMGVITIMLKIVKGEEATWEDLFSQEYNFWQFVWGSILYGLIVFGGFLLLIVPGIIWSITFSFFKYRIVEHGEGARIALRKSAEMTKGYRWKIFLFGFPIIGINILGALCLLIGLFVTIPFSAVAGALLYKKLSDAGHEEVPSSPVEAEEPALA